MTEIKKGSGVYRNWSATISGFTSGARVDYQTFEEPGPTLTHESSDHYANLSDAFEAIAAYAERAK